MIYVILLDMKIKDYLINEIVKFLFDLSPKPIIAALQLFYPLT